MRAESAPAEAFVDPRGRRTRRTTRAGRENHLRIVSGDPFSGNCRELISSQARDFISTKSPRTAAPLQLVYSRCGDVAEDSSPKNIPAIQLGRGVAGAFRLMLAPNTPFLE
jgi:hypothetical protein